MPREALERIVTDVVAALGVELGKLLTVSREEDALVVLTGIGWDLSTVGERVTLRDTSQAGYAARQEGPVIFEDLSRTRRFSDAPLLRRHGVRSSVAVALRDRGRLLGVISVHSRVRRTFSRADLDVIVRAARAAEALLARAPAGVAGRCPTGGHDASP